MPNGHLIWIVWPHKMSCCIKMSSTLKPGADYTWRAVMFPCDAFSYVHTSESLRKFTSQPTPLETFSFEQHFTGLDMGPFSGTQLSFSVSCVGSKCYCSPGSKGPGVRVTSVLSQGALLFPLVTTSLWESPLANPKLLHLPLLGDGDPTNEHTLALCIKVKLRF